MRHVTKYPDEQKLEAVVLARETTRQHAATEFGVSVWVIGKWTKLMIEQGRIPMEQDNHIDPCVTVVNRLQNSMEGKAGDVLLAELDDTNKNGHVTFIKDAMEVRSEILLKIRLVAAASGSLKDIVEAFKAVNDGIKLFSAALPVGQLEAKDDMWQTAQRLIDYRKEIADKEKEYRDKRLNNIELTPYEES